LQVWIKDISLTGHHVELKPLSLDYVDGLSEAVTDGELWKLWYTQVPNVSEVPSYIEDALTARNNSGEMPFVILDVETNRVIGSTRYCNVDSQNKRLEIGYSWYRKSAQRTAANTETKYLLLQHAFETLNAIAVEFRTNWFNHQSRVAISRLGAKQDGVLRNHKRMPDGTMRDTVIFSIINSEWASVKNHFEFKLKY